MLFGGASRPDVRAKFITGVFSEFMTFKRD